MDPVSLSKLATWSHATLLNGDPDALVTGVSHDTRTIKPGELYIALRGENFDGNVFIQEAYHKGAVGALCASMSVTSQSRPPQEPGQELPGKFAMLHVEDPLEGLTALAAQWRQELGLRSVVITGSNGKTSTKDFTTLLLEKSFHVTSTHGNFNNHIGLPLSILRANSSDQVAIWEIGMNHPGEILPLALLARPDIAIITNIGTAHIGFLGSREAIAHEKGNLLTTLSPDGLAILGAADDFCDFLASRTQARILRVGIGLGDLQATHLTSLPRGGMEFQVSYEGVSLPAYLPVMGAHMVQNALSALAVGLACKISLEEGIDALRKVQSSSSRLKLYEYGDIMVVDDAYNASPDSMEAALSSIAALESQRKIALLGCMGELGDYAMNGYERVGLKAAELLDVLIVVGNEALPLEQVGRRCGIKEVYHVPNNNEAIALALSIIRGGDVLLIKGSKRACLHEVVDAVRKSLLKKNLTSQ